MSSISCNRDEEPRGPSVADKVAYLSEPATYPHLPREVIVRETHMSWVFLAGDRVYKLKKPVTYPFLDFSTLQLREFNCREEVRLNRRLAPNVYLGVIPLAMTPAGNLALGDRSKIVDWLVEMRRLPDELLLDKAILANSVTSRAVESVSVALAEFYVKSKPVHISGQDYVERFAREHDLNVLVVTNRQFDLDGQQVTKAIAIVENMLRKTPARLEARALGSKIVDGHGDLRPEHICLEEPPVIIDCLEFNRDLRLADPLDEIAYLDLECTILGANWIGRQVLTRYLERSSDEADRELGQFYWAYRACLRARLSLVHILEHDTRKPEKWLPLARKFIGIASAVPSAFTPPGVR